MKQTTINTLFRALGEWQLRFRWPLLIFLIALTVFGFLGLPKLKTSSSMEDWFDDADEIQRSTDHFNGLFGNDESINILVEAEDIFDPEVLRAIKDISDGLMENIPYAKEVTSLTELDIATGNAEGLEIINPFENGIPDDTAELEKIRNLVLSRKSLENRIISDDSKETWISLSLYPYPDPTELKESDKDPLYVVGEAAIAFLTDQKWNSPKYRIYPVGVPYTETEELAVIDRETVLRVSTGFIAMVLCLIFFTRSFRGVFIPVVTTVSGIAVVFGIMGWLGIKGDSSLITLPILLGMALSVGYSVHLFNSFKRTFMTTGNRRSSVVSAVEDTGWPVLFTVLTTAAGLISFLFANIAPLRWLGLACSSVVISVYLYVMVLIPTLMSFGKNSNPKKENLGRIKTGIDSKFVALGELIIRNRKALLVTAILIAVAFLPGYSKLRVSMDYFEMMGMKIPYVQRLHHVVNTRLGSYLDYNVMIEFPESDTVKDPTVMQNYDRFVSQVGEFELTKRNGETPKASSVLDIVKEMNRTVHDDDTEFYRVPDDRDLLTQLLFLYEISGGSKLYEWVNEDYSILRAQFELSHFDSAKVRYEIGEIKKIAATLFPDAKVSVIGSVANIAEMNHKIVIGQLTSFLGAMIIIFFMLILVFGSFKTAAIGMIPNITPVLLIGGLVGYLNYSLDMLTMTVMPMLIGIAVDDTIHFINHIKVEYEKHGDYQQAILDSFRTVGSTLAMTSIILCASFVMYLFSPMATLFKIGLLATIGISSALVADYIMTPVLVYTLQPFTKGTGKNRHKKIRH